MSALVHVLPAALWAMVPITLAALGEIFEEWAGVVNIGLEGIMSISAFAAALGSISTGNPWLGVPAGLLMGSIVGLLHGLICVRLRGNQIISGVGINLLGMGTVGFGARTMWGAKAPMLDDRFWIPAVPGLGISPIVLLTPALVVFTWFLLFRTALGLRIRAVGENPVAADVVGVPVERLRLWASVYAGALGGLAGAFLSLDWLHTVSATLPAGRGFIALANVVFSKLNPFLAFVGGCIFGYFDALGIQLAAVAGVGGAVPYQFIRMIPYLVTLVVVTLAIGRARFPRALGQPYRRE